VIEIITKLKLKLKLMMKLKLEPSRFLLIRRRIERKMKERWYERKENDRKMRTRIEERIRSNENAGKSSRGEGMQKRSIEAIGWISFSIPSPPILPSSILFYLLISSPTSFSPLVSSYFILFHPLLSYLMLSHLTFSSLIPPYPLFFSLILYTIHIWLLMDVLEADLDNSNLFLFL
jgi:hypothetical protein